LENFHAVNNHDTLVVCFCFLKSPRFDKLLIKCGQLPIFGAPEGLKALFFVTKRKHRTVLRLVSHITATSLGFRTGNLYTRTDKKLDVFVLGKYNFTRPNKHNSLSKTSSPICKTL